MWHLLGALHPGLRHPSVGFRGLRADLPGCWWGKQRPFWLWEAALSAALLRELEEPRTEIEVLTEDHKALEEEVRRLRRAIAGLRAQDRSGYPDSEGSFSVLDSAQGGGSVPPSSPARSFESVGIRSTTTSGGPVAATAGVGPISWAEREEIAEGIGLWIRRCLEGGHRGPSGRDRNPLQSRLWLVIRSIEGEDFNPPLAFRSWGAGGNRWIDLLGPAF